MVNVTSRSFAHVLCPVDFSDTSMHGVDHAMAIAGWSGARLTLLAVRPAWTAHAPDLSVPDSATSAADVRRAQAQMDACVQLARRAGLPTDALIDIGRPEADIVNRAASLHADLIVMGTHGTSGFDRLVLGSVTEKVLRRATCPVLTVPPRAVATSALPLQRILCPVDLSDASLEAFAFARALAQEAGASVTVLHVLEWPWEEPPAPAFGELPATQATALEEYRAYIETSAMARLRSLVADAPAGDVRVTPRLSNGKAYKGILQVADEEKSNLIVMGVYRRGAADTTLLGSTTHQVVRRAACPVLTLRR